MPSHQNVNRPTTSTVPLPRPAVDVELLDGLAPAEEDLLVEEVSIDGMCGVY
jgi:mycofactocin precursor